MFDVRLAIDKAIEESGMKRAIVADRAGMTPQQLCDVVKGRRKLEANEMFALCNAIGKTPNELFAIEALKPKAG